MHGSVCLTELFLCSRAASFQLILKGQFTYPDLYQSVEEEALAK